MNSQERGVIVTFGGAAFNALREDQKLRVSDMMLSWHAVGGCWCYPNLLRRAIKKVLNNYP